MQRHNFFLDQDSAVDHSMDLTRCFQIALSAVRNFLAVSLLASPLYAQDFTLFESVDTTATTDRAEQRGDRGNRVMVATVPDFTLIGTTKIGDSYKAVLAHRDGASVVVDAVANNRTPIDGYSEFTVVDIASGLVTIELPEGASCADYPDKGVRCDSANHSLQLSLANGAPTRPGAVQANDQIIAEQNFNPAGQEPQPQDIPNNPFAALRAQAQGVPGARGIPPDQDPTSRGFVPRRIDPSEVPPGMRIVATPFGDRLVEQ